MTELPTEYAAADTASGPDVTEFRPAPLDGPGFRHRVLMILRGEWPVCPSCLTPFDGVRRRRVFDDREVKCPSCDARTSPRSGTILHGSNLSYGEFWIMWKLLELAISPEKIAVTLELSRSTVYDSRNRLTAAGML